MKLVPPNALLERIDPQLGVSRRLLLGVASVMEIAHPMAFGWILGLVSGVGMCFLAYTNSPWYAAFHPWLRYHQAGDPREMNTFRDDLLMRAFEARYPLWYSDEEREAFFARDTCPWQMRRAFELGKIHRGSERDLTASEVQELDDMCGVEQGLLFKRLQYRKQERELMEGIPL